MYVFIKAVMEVQILICIVIYIVMGQKAMIFPQQRNKGAVMANINLLPQLANKIYDESIRYSFTIAAIIGEKISTIYHWYSNKSSTMSKSSLIMCLTNLANVQPLDHSNWEWIIFVENFGECLIIYWKQGDVALSKCTFIKDQMSLHRDIQSNFRRKQLFEIVLLIL